MAGYLPWSRIVTVFVLGAACATIPCLQADGPVNPEAEKLLRSAQDALAQKNYPQATKLFRDVVTRFAMTSSGPAAKFGLAVCLVDGHDKKYKEAHDLLAALAKARDKGPDAWQVLYYQAAAERGLAYDQLAAGAANPKDSAKFNKEAAAHLATAADDFGRVQAAFETRAGKWSPGTMLSPDAEWAARALCDRAEVLLRRGEYGPASKATAVFLQPGPYHASRVRDLGAYYYGLANFLLKDYAVAEKTLSMLAPFTDPRYGTHTRYLLARLYHLNDERAEASYHYDGVLSGFEREKKQAQELLKKPDVLAKDPLLKIRAESLVREVPEYVLRAFFYSAVLLQESSRFAEARDRFVVFTKAPKGYAFELEAKVRLGICQVQLKEAQAALNTLQPLADADKGYSDQVYLWMARAAMMLVPDPNQKGPYAAAVNRVINLYQEAEKRLLANSANDPSTKQRHGELLLELADTLLQFHQIPQAVKVCDLLTKQQLLPARNEEVSVRLATALHLAGDYAASDSECQRFLTSYPQSLLAPEILFRYAENSYYRTLAAEKDPQQKDNLKALRAETIQRYQKLLEQYPGYPRAANAQFAIGQLFYHDGDYAKAQGALEAIPAAERTGELVAASYLLADCLLRQAPPGVPEDALAAGKLDALLKTSIELLDGFISAQPNGPQTPEALMRLGQTMQRLASLQAQVPERNKIYTDARAQFEKILQPQFAKHPLYAQALLERARCRVAYGGDINKSSTELRQFLTDPLKQSAAAPLAVVQLGTWLRAQNKGGEAAALLGAFATDFAKRKPKEKALLGQVVYQQGLALRDAGNMAAARTAFTSAAALIPDQPEGMDAALRWALCRKDESKPLADRGATLLASANPKEREEGAQKLAEATRMRQEATTHLEKEIARLKDKQPLPDVVARMLFEAAWIYRDLAEQEAASARADALKDWAKKMGANATKVGPPEIAPTMLALSADEKKARERYQTLIELFPDLPLAQDARLELAESLALRDESDEAIKLLTEALDREPSPEMTEKVRFLLGVCQAAKGNTKAALAQFDIVGQVPKSYLSAQAKYRAAECLMRDKQYPEAIKRFAVFRDVPQFQQLIGLSDRALLRIGEAHAYQKQWDAARQAFDLLAQRFGGSKYVGAARFGQGWSLEQLNQLDPAANAYNQAAASAGVAEIGAEAQIRLGLCRFAQKRYKEAADAFLVVPAKYGYPTWNAVALLEAAEAQVQLKQLDPARMLLGRVIAEYPETPSAAAAKKRLAELK